MKLLALVLTGVLLLSVACGATGEAASKTCSYTLDGSAVAAFPPTGYPSSLVRYEAGLFDHADGPRHRRHGFTFRARL